MKERGDKEMCPACRKFYLPGTVSLQQRLFWCSTSSCSLRLLGWLSACSRLVPFSLFQLAVFRKSPA